MNRLLVLAIPTFFAGGCSTENHLLDPVHTPLVEVSSERPDEGRGAAEFRPATPADREHGTMGPWPWP